VTERTGRDGLAVKRLREVGNVVVGTGVIGREAELIEVGQFLDQIGGGFAALVIEGEPGIGKTTIWQEARRRAEQRGLSVVWCRASEAEAKLSFSAVGDLLAPVAEEPFAGLPEPQREALEVALLRRRAARRGPDRRAVAAGFLSLLRAIASMQQLVLAIDDWQWLDAPSRRVIEFAVRRLESERIGLLCSLRAPAPDRALDGAAAEDRLRRMPLSPLSLAALGRIVADRLGRSLPRPLLVRVAKASRGNPFYALEIARLLADRGPAELGLAELPVSDDLRTLIQDRIEQLPPSAQDAVLQATVLSALDSGKVDAAMLAPAEEAGIVVVDDRGRVEFTHPLFASAAYGALPLARRRELHRRAGEMASDPEQRARHVALGAEHPDPAVARQLDQAAARAASRGAPDAAAELAELAATHTPEAASEARMERFLKGAHFHFDAGDLARAEALAQEVLGSSTPTRLRARALQLAAQLCARRSNFSEASMLASAALEAAGDDQRLRAGIELDLVYCAVSLGDIAAAQPHARGAVTDAEAAGESGMLADALAVLTMAEFLSGRGLDHARLSRALELEDPLGASAFIMRPRVIHGMLQLWSGELDGALRALEAVYAETIERGQEGTAPMLALYLVWAHVWRGQLERAAHVSDRAREAAELLDDPTVSGLALSASALAHAHDGRVALAHAEAQEALALFERVQWRSGVIWPLWALGLALLSEGQPAAVDAVLAPLAETLAAMGAGDPVMASFLPDEVEALIALGELERAESYLEPFERAARALDRQWALAAAQRCRGALAGKRGEAQLAFAAFERALAAHDCTAMPFERARTLLVAGQVYRRFKQRGRARRLLGEALEVFEQLGSPLWAGRARAELARVGRPGAGGDELTMTERRLAELAATGLSNREVAERAFVSVKTVEANLTRVYRKLGVRSRVTLARALQDSSEPRPPGSPQS
jgi:DNA-binding CsgD family transcriptional regulator